MTTDSELFVFVGEALALDLVNTTVVIRGKQRDLLQTPGDLAQWWEAARHQHSHMDRVRDAEPVVDAAFLRDVKALRDALRRLFTAIAEGEEVPDAEIAVLNDVLSMGHPVVEWQAGQEPQMVYDAYHDEQAGLLLPVALSALKLITEADLTRLHKCHNDRCILLFYDTTRSATRQWCSTACFDRERSLLRYEEKKRSENG
ncbi:MAG: ABATE domain-containing protein [Chloroflexi bacterium]|nr:ABATE domain-containing protein [Chloroflexota bacterium]